MALTYNIQFNADTRSLKNQLADLHESVERAFSASFHPEFAGDLNRAVGSAKVLEQAMRKATTTNGTSFVALNAELKKAGVSASEILTSFSSAQMRQASSSFIETFTTANKSAVVLSRHVKEIGRVLTQSFKFSAAQSFLRFTQSALQSGLRWSVDMNKALTNISIVTKATGDDLDRIFKDIVAGAGDLKIAAKEYAEASLIFHQQGLGEAAVANRSEITVKAAKAAGQSTEEMSKNLTTIWNTYKMQGERLENAASIGARLGAETAVDFKYIAEAMQSAAPAAAQLGVAYESLAAITATVGEVSMQSASVVGNAYKTIFSRFANLKTTGEDEGVTLGRITEQFAEMGIHVLDSSGTLKELDEVIMDTGNRWGEYSTKQQQAIAQIAGGTRQFGQFLSLMNNFDKYKENLQSAMAEKGGETLNQQFEVWTQSIEAAANIAKESWAQAFSEMFQQDSIKSFYNTVAELGTIFGDVVSTIGGLPAILGVIGVIMSSKIAAGATSLLVTSREYLSNLTLTQRYTNAMAAAETQYAAVVAQRQAAEARGNETLARELTLLEQKLATSRQITGTMTQLQALEQSGNPAQRQRAATEIELLSIAQRQRNAALDELGAAQQELAIAELVLNNAREVTTEMRTQAELARTRVATAGERVLDTDNAVGVVLEDASVVAEQANTSVVNYGHALTAMASTAMVAAFAIESMTHVMDDGKASMGEIAGIVLNVTMLLGGLTQVVKALNIGFSAQGVHGAAAMTTEAIAARTTAAAARVDARAAQREAAAANTAAEVAEARAARATASAARSDSRNARNTASRARGAANTARDRATEATTAAREAAEASTAAGTAATAAGSGATIAWLPLAAILATVAAAIYICYQAWQEVNNLSPKKQLNDAKDAASNLATELEAASTAAKDLASAFEKLDEFDSTLSGLTQGTKEWKDSLKEANREILDLLAVYPELAKYAERNEAGQIVIDKEGREEAQALADEKVDTVTTALTLARGTVRDRQAAIDRDKIVDSIVGTGKLDSGTKSDVGIESTASSAVDNVLKNFTGVLDTDVARLTEALAKNENITEAAIGRYVAEFKAAHQDISSWQESIENNTLVREMENEENAKLLLGDEYIADDAKDATTEAGSRVLEALTSKYFKEIDAKAAERDFADRGTKNAEDMWKQYTEAMQIQGADVKNYKGDGSVEYEYTKENGDIQKANVTSEQIAAVLAAKQANDEFNASAETLILTLNTLATAQEDQSQATISSNMGLIDFISDQELMNTTYAEYLALRDQAGASGENSGAYLGGMFGDKDGVLLDEEAAALGFNSAEAMIASFNEGLSNAEIGWDSIELPPNLNGADALGLNAAKDFKVAFDKASRGSMTGGGEEMVKGFNKITAGMSPKDLEKTMGVLTNVDWTQWNGAENVMTALSNLGVTTSITNDEWQELVKTMQIANNASPIDAIKELTDAMSNLHKITAEIEIGSIISDEDYKTLLKANPALKDLFLTMMDGSKKLIGNPDIVKNLGIDEAIASLKEKSRQYNQFKQEDFSYQENGAKVKPDWSAIAAGEQGDAGKTFEDLKESSVFKDIVADYGYNAAELDKISEEIKNNNITRAKEIIGVLGNFMDESSLLDVGAQVQEMIASTATSTDQLAEMLQKQTINSDAYGKAFLGLVDNQNELRSALQAGMIDLDQYLGKLQELDGASKMEGLDAKEVDDYGDWLQETAEQSDLLNDSLKNNPDAADDVAQATLRMNKGIEKLSGSYEDWNDILRNSDKSSQEYSSAMTGMKDSLADILNISEDFISNNFVAENLDLIKEAAAGSEEAILSLQFAAAKNITLGVLVDNGLEGLGPSILSEIAELQTMIPDITVGTVFTGTEEFIAKAMKIVESAKMTADQANAFFGSMGFQTEFATEKKEITRMASPVITETSEPEIGYVPNIDPPYPYMKKMTTTTRQGAPVPITDWVDAIAMTTSAGGDKKPVAPKITYTGSGAMNNSSKRNSGGGGKKGGGGGGGGGGSAPKAVTAKPQERTERFKDTGDALEEIARRMEKVDTASGEAFGRDKLLLLAQNNLLLQEQSALLLELEKEATNYLRGSGGRPVEFGNKFLVGNDQDVLKQMSEALNIKAPEFTSDEFVKNIQEIQTAIDIVETEWAKARGKWDESEGEFNFGAGDGAEKVKTEFELLQKKHSDYLDAIERNNDSATKLEEARAKRIANIYEWLSNKLAETDYKLEIKTIVNDAEIRQLEFLLDRLGDSAGRIKLDNLGKSVDVSIKKAKDLIANNERLSEIIRNINTQAPGFQDDFEAKFGESAWAEFRDNGGALTQEMIDNLMGKAEDMQEIIEGLYDHSEQIFGQFRESLDVYIKDFDRLISRFDNSSSELDSWTRLWEIAGDSVRNTQMRIDLMTKSIDTQSSKVKGMQQQYTLLAEQVGNAQKIYEAALAAHGAEDKITQDALESWKDLQDQVGSTQADLLSGIADIAEMFEEKAALMAETIRKEFEQSISGLAADLEGLRSSFDQKKGLDKFYMNEEDAGSGMGDMMDELQSDPSKIKDSAKWEELLNSKIEKRIVQTEILGEMREQEIWVAKDGVKLTEKELAIMQEEFELAKEQAAFEDQQAAKNTMRLSRDSSGNWTYIYSADTSDAEDKSKALEDRIANIRKMHREAADEYLDAVIDGMQEWADFESNVDQKRYEQDEKYRQQVDMQREWYKQMMDNLSTEVGDHLGAIDMAFGDTTLGTILNLESMEAANDHFKENIQQLSEGLRENWQENQQQMKDRLDEMGIDMDDFENIVREETDKIIEKNKETEDSLQELKNTASNELNEMTSSIEQWSQRWQSEIRDIISALEDLIRKNQELAGGGSPGSGDWSEDIGNAMEDQNQGEHGGMESTKSYEEIRDRDDVVNMWKNRQDKLDSMTDEQKKKTLTNEQLENLLLNQGLAWDKQLRWVIWDGKKRVPVDLVKFAELSSNGGSTNLKDYTYDTGGLATGPQIAGLAMDGKKELVLNNNDTKNMLEAISIMRDGISAYLGNIGINQAKIISETRIINNPAEAVQTPVIIQADFPNVSARDEIEAAFENLVNQAAQYTIKPRN